MEKTDQAAVRESAKVLAETIDIPDGPNVAPSPLEHLAAQGTVVEPPGAEGGNPPIERTDDDADAPKSSHGNDPKERVSPAEQGLVDEQRRRDSEASRQERPASSEVQPR